jgi:general secretion pathway protein G
MRTLRHQGFSLIELMVVVTIIGILASIIYANFGGGNAKARDTERQTDLRVLQSAIAQYKQQNGRYPLMGIDSDGNGYASESESAMYIASMTPTYIQRLPTDPRRGSNPGYSYAVDATGSVYKLVALRTVETELVTHDHPFKSCDVRVGNVSGSLVSGSTDREVIGWCGRTAQAGNGLPNSCNAAQAPFNNTYGVWGGFLAKSSASCSNSMTNCVQNTTAVICL